MKIHLNFSTVEKFKYRLLRLVKPLKEGKILPLIDLAKVYKTTEQFGFDINVKADFGYSYNKKLIEITKKDYESLCNSLDNFPKEADEEL